MLGRLTKWLSSRTIDEQAEHLQHRVDALRRMKFASLALLHEEKERQAKGNDSRLRPRFTQDDERVQELFMALEKCLTLGLKEENKELGEKAVTLWHVLSETSKLVDEPMLDRAVETAALLSDTDEGKARCWLKITLNSHSLESSLMIIYSMTCESILRDSYQEWALVCCFDALDIFLQFIADIRDIRFSLLVNDDSFEDESDAESNSSDAIRQRLLSLSSCGDDGGDTTENLDIPSILPDEFVVRSLPVEDFPHRLNEDLIAKPWKHVFGVSLQSLTKKQYHCRYALVDPVLAIPNIIEDCLIILEKYAATPRLFRRTVVKSEMEKLRAAVECDQSIPEDAQSAGALLLDFLSTLPQPLLTNDMMDAFLACDTIPDEDASTRNIALLVNELPVESKVVLERIIYTFTVLLKEEAVSVNQLDLSKVANVFAPAIAFRSQLTAVDSKTNCSQTFQVPHVHNNAYHIRSGAIAAPVIERMINHYDDIFHDVSAKRKNAIARWNKNVQEFQAVDKNLHTKVSLAIDEHVEKLETISRVFVERYLSNKGSPISRPRPSLQLPSFNFGILSRHNTMPAVLGGYSDKSSTESTSKKEDKTTPGKKVTARKSFPSTMGNSVTQTTTLSDSIKKDNIDVETADTTETIQSATNNEFNASNLFLAEQSTIDAWKAHGFNHGTIVDNFDTGGVLLLDALLFVVIHETELLDILRDRATPKVYATYDAGRLCRVMVTRLVDLLSLSHDDNIPVDGIQLSRQPFWKILNGDHYFETLFALLCRMFDQIWEAWTPEIPSFLKVMKEAEEEFQLLLNKAPSSVNELIEEWDDKWRKLMAMSDGVGFRGRKEKFKIGVKERSPRKKSRKKIPISAGSLNNRNPILNSDIDEDMSKKLLSPSSILSPDEISELNKNLPITCQLNYWCKTYSTSRDGASLQTLIMLADSQSPTLLVIKDDMGNVFGGFASDPWHRNASQYYGTGSCFLWSFQQLPALAGSDNERREKAFVKYSWSGKNPYFMLCSTNALIMGGGGNFGLHLDSDLLSGQTGACETYNSPPLVRTQAFTCVECELWSFTPDKDGETTQTRRAKSARSILM